MLYCFKVRLLIQALLFLIPSPSMSFIISQGYLKAMHASRGLNPFVCRSSASVFKPRRFLINKHFSSYHDVLEIQNQVKLSPRMKRIQRNIDVYNTKKKNPLMTKIQPLKLPTDFDPYVSCYEDILKAITGYEKAGQCKNIFNLCLILERRGGDMLSANGGLILRNMVISELKMNRNDLAMNLLKQFGESSFRNNLVSDENRYSSDLHDFIVSLCQHGSMEAATYMVHTFELLHKKHLDDMIKSRHYGGAYESKIVSSVSAHLESMSSQLDVDPEKDESSDENEETNTTNSSYDELDTGEKRAWYEYIPSVYASLVEGYIRCDQPYEAAAMMKRWRLDAHHATVTLQQQHQSVLNKRLKDKASQWITPPQRLFRVSCERASSLMQTTISSANKHLLFDLLDTFHVTGSVPNEIMNERLVHALVQSISFKTGAVSVDTLPQESIPEVAVIGRSNVGKSSLINFVVGRKAMAYTSKTPGKTQQFNYFSVNEDSKWTPKAEFYLVDLPGVGYAKVPKPVRDMWKGFMERYLTERATLKVVFHLIDSRHGPVAQDEVVMSMMSKVPKRIKYVVVLTKVDKKNSKQTLQDNIESVKSKLVEFGKVRSNENVPILLTSSLSRRGRNDIWRHLKHVISEEDQ